MQSLAHFYLPSIDSIIDFSPLTVASSSPVWEAIALLNQSQSHDVLVVDDSRLLGCFTSQDVVRLISSGVDLKTAKIDSVMSSVITLKQSDFHDLATVLSLLRQHQLSMLPIVDEQNHLLGKITSTSICQALETKTSNDELFRQLVENICEVFFVRDPKSGKILYVSPAYETIWGRSCLCLYENPRDFIEAIHPEDSDRVIADINAQTSGKPDQQEYRILRPDGEIRTISSRAFPLKDDNNQVYRIIGIAQDITLAKQAIEVLRESEERFHTMADSAPVFIWMADIDAQCTFVNQPWLNFTGRTQQQEQGFGWAEGIHPEDKQRSLDIYLRAYHARKRFRMEYRLLSADGEYRWLLDTGVPRFTSNGNFTGYVGSCIDITKLKQTNQELEMRVTNRTKALKQINRQLVLEMTDRLLIEKQLRQTQEQLQAILDNSSAIIYVVDTENRYLLVNREFEKLFNITQAEIVGKSLYEVWSDHIAEGFAINNREVLANNIPIEVEEVAPQGGELYTYLSMKFPLIDTNGVAYAVCGISTNITERKRAESELKQSEERFRLLIEGVKDYAIFLLDPQGRIVSWNSGAERITGYEASEIIGQHFSCFRAPQDAITEENKELLIAAATGRFEYSGDRIRKDGSHFWANIVTTALRDNTGLRGFSKLIRDITERKAAESALLRKKQVIENTSDAIGISDIAGNVIYLNRAFIELFDYTIEELNAAGGPPALYTKRVEAERMCDTVLRGESWCGEVTMQTRNGRRVQTYLRADAIRDAEGKITGTVGIHTDISGRKRIEQTLKLRDRAIAACNNGIAISDAQLPDAPLVYVNPAFEKMSGYTAVEVIGRNCRFLQGTDTQQPEIKQLRAAIREKEDCTVILRNYHKDGSLFWNKLNVSPVFDAKGVCTHYIGISTDVSDRKQAETALIVLQERLQYLLSSSPGTIYTCNTSLNYSITFVSENVTLLLGYEVREFLEVSDFWASHIHPEDAPQVFAQMSKIFEQQQYNYEYRFLHQDGIYRWIYNQAKLVRDESGIPLEIIGYWVDITERKQLEQEITTALEKEKELNELKSRFISMTSHEFRTPLSTILSSCELLEHYRHKWTQEKQLTHLHRIQTAVKRMTEMFNDVLFISKEEAGKLECRTKNLDLVKYCRHLVEEVLQNLGYQQELTPNPRIVFSSASEFMQSCMDEKLLGHILINLLSNAIKYSSIDSTVKFNLTFKDGQAIFAIQDQGIGIPSEDLPHLYESFHRATNVGNLQGTGLGLAIVKKCVDIHKGEIFVTSEVGIGTTFTVILPLRIEMLAGDKL